MIARALLAGLVSTISTSLAWGGELADPPRHPCVDEGAKAIRGAIATRLENDGTVGGGSTILFFLEGESRAFKLAGVVFGEEPERLAAGREIVIYLTGAETDRYGRVAVQGFDVGEDGTLVWIQGQYLAKGVALHDGGDVPGGCRIAYERGESLAGKRVARFDHKASRTKALLQDKGRFVRVRGKVLSIGDRERRLYLNFGENWRQDFTVIVEKTGKRRYKGALSDLTGLAGRWVTVRGMLEEAGGPMIRLNSEAQLEIDGGSF